MDIRYSAASGDACWYAVAAGPSIALLSPDVSPMTAEAVWRRLGTAGVAALLDALTGAFGTSLTVLPSFALISAEQDGIRVTVRGPLDVIVEGVEGTEQVTGRGVSTWAERLVPGAVRASVQLDGARDAAAALPLSDGVVPVTAVAVTVRTSDAPAAGAPDADARGAAADVPAVDALDAAGASADGPVADVPDADVPDADARRVDAPGAAGAPTDAPVGDAPDAAGGAGTEATAGSVTSSRPAAGDAPAVTLGATTTTASASTTTDEHDEASTAGPPDVRTETTWLPGATSSAVPTDEEMLLGETVARPRATPQAAVANHRPAGGTRAEDHDGQPGAKVAAAALGDHDGETIVAGQLAALRAESTDNVPPRRPTRGRLRLSTGRVVELERTVVIGRRPKSTRSTHADLPTLVTVESPGQDISRSHVEVRTEGDHVLVTDLHTTNGTLLRRGSQDPVHLHPGEATMVVSGDVLDIGDGVTVAFEDLP